MLLCAVYAVSKVAGKEIQFKQIVSSYKGLPFGCAQVSFLVRSFVLPYNFTSINPPPPPAFMKIFPCVLVFYFLTFSPSNSLVSVKKYSCSCKETHVRFVRFA